MADAAEGLFTIDTRKIPPGGLPDGATGDIINQYALQDSELSPGKPWGYGHVVRWKPAQHLVCIHGQCYRFPRRNEE